MFQNLLQLRAEILSNLWGDLVFMAAAAAANAATPWHHKTGLSHDCPVVTAIWKKADPVMSVAGEGERQV